MVTMMMMMTMNDFTQFWLGLIATIIDKNNLAKTSRKGKANYKIFKIHVIHKWPKFLKTIQKLKKTIKHLEVHKHPKFQSASISLMQINNNTKTNNTFTAIAKILSLWLYYSVQFFFCLFTQSKIIIALLMKSSFESLFDRWIYFSLLLYQFS